MVHAAVDLQLLLQVQVQAQAVQADDTVHAWPVELTVITTDGSCTQGGDVAIRPDAPDSHSPVPLKQQSTRLYSVGPNSREMSRQVAAGCMKTKPR